MTVDRPALLNALTALKPAVPRKTTLPILECVRLAAGNGTLALVATDLDLRLETAIPCDGPLVPLCVSHDLLLQYVKKQTTDTIRFTATDEALTLKGNNQLTLPYYPGGDYPEGWTVTGDPLTLDLGQIGQPLKAIRAFVSSDSHRPAMQGAYFHVKDGALVLVSTDGHRLCRVETGLPFAGTSAVVPTPLLAALPDETVTYRSDGQFVELKGATVTAQARLIDEAYPNYEAVIPTENDKTLRVDPTLFHDAVERALLATSTMTNQVRVTLNGDLTVEAEDIERARTSAETVEADFDGGELTIGFNGLYLAEVLSYLTDAAVWRFSSPNRAAVVQDGPTLYLCMPVLLTSFA